MQGLKIGGAKHELPLQVLTRHIVASQNSITGWIYDRRVLKDIVCQPPDAQTYGSKKVSVAPKKGKFTSLAAPAGIILAVTLAKTSKSKIITFDNLAGLLVNL